MPEMSVGFGFGLDLRRGCGVEGSLALLSGEVDRGVEGVARPPAVSNFGPSAERGLFFEWFELFLGLRGCLGCPEDFRSSLR